MLGRLFILVSLLVAIAVAEEMLHCDFEDGNDCNGWSNSNTPGSRWEVIKTGSEIKGAPSTDTTIGEGGSMLAFSPGNGVEEAEYVSPSLSYVTDYTGTFCLQFYYYVSGFMGKLTVSHSGTTTHKGAPIFLKSLMSERKKNTWVRYEGTVSSTGAGATSDRVVISASAFHSKQYTGFFAVDDIWISKGTCEEMAAMLNKESTPGSATTTSKPQPTQPTQAAQPSNEELNRRQDEENRRRQEENERKQKEELEKIRQQEEYNRMRNENPEMITSKPAAATQSQPIQPTQPAPTTHSQPTQPTQPDNSIFNDQWTQPTLDWRMNNPDFHICGDTFVNISSEICCQQIPQQRVPNAMCCGMFACDPMTEICCGEDYYLKSETTFRCCGRYSYDTATQGCCGGWRVHDLQNVAEQCCGGQIYDAKKKSCCGHQVYRHGTRKCCVNAVYNINYFGCCEGQKYPFRTQSCENGVVMRKGKNEQQIRQ